MTESEIIEVLATKILGWKLSDYKTDWIVKKGSIMSVDYFDPIHNLSHAWLLMSQFEESLLRRRMNGLNFRAWIQVGEKEYVETGLKPSKAIVNVMLKYLGYEERI